MGYKRHIFYQPECDYPDFGKLLQVESGGQSIIFLGRVPQPLWSWVNAFPFH